MLLSPRYSVAVVESGLKTYEDMSCRLGIRWQWVKSEVGISVSVCAWGRILILFVKKNNYTFQLQMEQSSDGK